MTDTNDKDPMWFLTDFHAGLKRLPGTSDDAIRLLALLVARLIVLEYDDKAERNAAAKLLADEMMAVVANDGYGRDVRRH
jgi:hypothetical protein